MKGIWIEHPDEELPVICASGVLFDVNVGRGPNPHDPDAKITKMKDGRTHLAHKAEHAVDMDSQAIVA